MDLMFSDCISLKSLELSNFNSKSVTTMNYMFQQSSNLTSLDLRSFIT